MLIFFSVCERVTLIWENKMLVDNFFHLVPQVYSEKEPMTFRLLVRMV